MTMADVPILSIVTFLPLLGAIAVAILPSRFARATALGFALVTWVVSLALLVAYVPGDPGFQFGVEIDWIPVFGIQYQLGADGLAVALVVLTTTMSWISILASFKPIQTRIKEYMVSFLVLEVGLIGVFLALDLFLFYIFWEIVLVPMYLIIGIWGGANRIYATIKFVLYTLVGSLLMLVAILATAFAYQESNGGSWVGAFDFVTLRDFATSGAGFAPALQIGAFLAFFLAFAIKVPMFPFHTWLPDAHTEAPTAGSVMLAAIMLKLGAYGFIRFAVPLFPDAAATFAPAIIVLSLIAIIYGAIVALVQPDLKRLVAYSSVSHMGFVTLGVFVFTQQGVQGAILQMINHGLITGALFLLVGVIYERTHDRTIAKMGGLAAQDAGLRRRVRVLRVRLGRAPRAVGLRRRVPDAGRHVRGQPRRGRHRDRGDGPRRGLPAVHVRPDRLRRGLAVLREPRAPPDRHVAGRDPDPRADRRARGGLRRPAGPAARPRRGHGDGHRDLGHGGHADRALHRARRPAADAADRRGGGPDRLRPARLPFDHDGRRARGRRGGALSHDLFVLSPLIAAILTAAAVLIVDLIRPGRPAVTVGTALVGLAITGAVTLAVGVTPDRVFAGGPEMTAFGGAYTVDALTTFLDVLFIAIIALTICFAPDYLVARGLPVAEFAVVLLFAMTGAMLLSASTDLLLLFLGLELMVLPGYLLAGYHKTDAYSTEGAIKYFLLGSFSSAIFLFGLAFIWGMTGTTRVDGVSQALESIVAGGAPLAPGLAMGLAFLTTGVAFKIAAVPFHYWTPDAYQGSPTPITGYLSVGPKIGAFALILRLFGEAIWPLHEWWLPVVMVLAAADDDPRQPRGADAGQRQADARVQLDRAHRLHAGRARGLRGRPDPGPRGPALLLGRLRGDEPGRVRGDRRAPEAAGRHLAARHVRRARPQGADPRDPADALPPVADRHPADRRASSGRPT